MRPLSRHSLWPVLAALSSTSLACGGAPFASSSAAPSSDAGGDSAPGTAYVPTAVSSGTPDAPPTPAWDAGGAAAVVDAGCVPSAAPDVPNDSFTDTNCDGINGDKSHAIFVAPSGSDFADGSFGAPVQTFGAAVPLALAQNKDIYACNATYAESIRLIGSAVNIYGGYDCAHGWRRVDDVFVLAPPSAATRMADPGGDDGGTPAKPLPSVPLVLRDIGGSVTIDHAKLVAPDAINPGDSSVASLVSNCPNVTFHQVQLNAGAGADGADGVPSDAVLSAAPSGGNGQDGSGAWSCGLPWSPPSAPWSPQAAPSSTSTPTQPVLPAMPTVSGPFGFTIPIITLPLPPPTNNTNNGGLTVIPTVPSAPAGCYQADFVAAGGLSSAAATCGSAGGVGGSKSQAAQGGLPAGYGGRAGDADNGVAPLPGTPGQAGAPGSPAAADPSSGFALGVFTADGFQPTSVGSDGIPGSAGGGGGGGGAHVARPYCGQGMYSVWVWAPGGGGEGGYGGSGGAAGHGGSGGGASVGLLSVGSHVSLSVCQVNTSDGGRGGNPSSGAAGQPGGLGGAGGTDVSGGGSCGALVQASGSAQDGAPGGQGGAGGSGGAGGGGPSVGIVSVGASPTASQVVFNGGAGGKGGSGLTGNGPDGLSGEKLSLDAPDGGADAAADGQ